MSEQPGTGRSGSPAERGLDGVEGNGLRGIDLAKAALAAARAHARQVEAGRAARRGGAQQQRSSARPDERDPQPLESTLSRLLAEAGWEAPAAVGGVFHGWADIVGGDIAAHCKPAAYDEGVLTLHTDSQIWAIELRYAIPKMMTKINAALPRRSVPGGPSRAAVERIEILGPDSLVRRRGRLSVNGGVRPRRQP
ncbi:MAG: DUF721 domain-containing protein [Actinocrinis sp.]